MLCPEYFRKIFYAEKLKTSKLKNTKIPTKHRVRRRKEITKIRAELNNIKTKSTILRINKSRSWFFEKTNKIDKALSRLIKKKGEGTQINKIRYERGEITTDTTEKKRTVRNYYEQPYAKKFENPGEMDRFLEKYNLPKRNQGEAESLNRRITNSWWNRSSNQKSPSSQKPWMGWFHRRILQSIEGIANPYIPQTLPKNPRRCKTPKCFLWSQHHSNPQTR